MKKLFDLNDPFFRPLWIRVVIVLFSAGWGIFEFVAGAPTWGTLFCAISAYAFYGFFIAFEPREPHKDDEGAGRDSDASAG
jgi:hypothetical protein